MAKAKPAKNIPAPSKTTPSDAAEVRSATAVSKSRVIRQYALKHPNAGPAEIAKALKASGIDIDARYVSKIRIRLKAKAALAKPTAPTPSKPIAASLPKLVVPAPAKPVAKATVISQPPATEKMAEKEQVRVADLRAAKEFVQQLGGLDQVQRVIALLAELTR